MDDSITLDYYMFLLTLGIPYEGFVTDEDGVVYRSLCEPVVVPPESLYIGSPPGVNYSQRTFLLLTKSALYYFPQDNMPDADDIARKIKNHIVRINTDGTTTVDFGRGDIMVMPTYKCDIKVSVTGSSGSLASPVVHIRVRDGSGIKAKETTMTLGAAEAVYGIDFRSMTDVKSLPDVHLSPSETGTSGGNSDLLTLSRALSAGGLGISALELGAGKTTYRMRRMRGQKFSPKLYRSGWHGGSRGQIKVHSAKKTLKKTGWMSFGLGTLLDIGYSFADEQPWGKTIANFVVNGTAVMISGVPGLIIGTAYFGLDLLGVFDDTPNISSEWRTSAPDYYSPADNTRICIPDILNEDEHYLLPVDAEYLERFILDR
ncbi:MAG: hypothetical protein LBJ63_07315 [Prevotellaceae bacterium]|jgi:hypothetical protein|nr:hypothetical protein [Prevotellaceae bacterium]